LPFGCFDPGRHQAAQVACLQQLLGQYPIYGLKTATSYLHSHITDLLRAGSVLLDFAAEHDLPVTIHTAIIEGDPWANVHEVLRVVQARPDVRFIIAHACRFEQRSLELAASLPNAFVDCAALHIHCLLAQQNHPAVAARRNRFAADYRSPANVLHKLADAYPETMVWGSDTPAHYWKSRFCDTKGEVAWLNLPCGSNDEVTTLKKLPGTVQVKIARQNTLCALFGSVAHTRRRMATTKRNSQVQHLQTTSDKRRP